MVALHLTFPAKDKNMRMGCSASRTRTLFLTASATALTTARATGPATVLPNANVRRITKEPRARCHLARASTIAIMATGSASLLTFVNALMDGVEVPVTLQCAIKSTSALAKEAALVLTFASATMGTLETHAKLKAAPINAIMAASATAENAHVCRDGRASIALPNLAIPAAPVQA